MTASDNIPVALFAWGVSIFVVWAIRWGATR